MSSSGLGRIAFAFHRWCFQPTSLWVVVVAVEITNFDSKALTFPRRSLTIFRAVIRDEGDITMAGLVAACSGDADGGADLSGGWSLLAWLAFGLVILSLLPLLVGSRDDADDCRCLPGSDDEFLLAINSCLRSRASSLSR